MIVRKYNIAGRVQGVGFRYFVCQAARQLKLQGTVRNLADGSVECIAAAPPDRETALAQLEQRLRQGPPHSRVDHVYIEELAGAFARELPAAFEII